jgi:hypothetical protein
MRLIDVLTASVLACVVCSACGSDKAQGSAAQTGSAAERKDTAAGTGAAAATEPAKAADGEGAKTGDGAAAKAPEAGAKADGAGAKAAEPAAVAPGSAAEKVQQAAPGMKVSAADLKVDGIELFVVSDDKPAPDGTRIADRLVGVAGGKVVEGNELVRAALAAKANPKTLAQVALRVVQYDAEILEEPSNAEQRKAKVRPPRFAGKALVFWVSTMGRPRRLEQARLDRTTGGLEIAVPPAMRAAAITSALVALVDPNVSIDGSAIRMLAGACGEPRVKNALVTTMANHPQVETRAAIADVLHKCGPDAIQPLINAMEQDRALVRSRAATALGRIGDGRARPALGKASKSDDANLAWAAKNALGKLK